MRKYLFLLRLETKYARLVLLFVPLIVTSVWGTSVHGDAYITFVYAKNLAAGRELAYGLAVAGAASPLRTPLYILLLALLAKLGIPLLQASIVLSALGWGLAALALDSVGRAIGRPTAAVVSAVLIAFNPMVVSTLGTETPWVLAFFWIAVALGLKRRWWAQTGVLITILWTYFDWITLALAAAMLGWQWISRSGVSLCGRVSP